MVAATSPRAGAAASPTPNKSLTAIAVEAVPASPRQAEGIKRSRFITGSARIAVLPSATELGGFVRGAAKPGARIITDVLKSYLSASLLRQTLRRNGWHSS